MKILITGNGITGKSMFRRQMVKEFRTLGLVVDHFDADCFKELRHPADADCLYQLPRFFLNNVLYIIEDVHGTIEGAAMPLDHYNLVFYLKPSQLTHLLFWLSRIPRWIKSGQHSWEQSQGWQGTNQPNDWRNLLPIAKHFFRNLAKYRSWVKQDMIILRSLNYKIVESNWTRQGPKFKIRI